MDTETTIFPELRKRILRRVYWLWFWRRVAPIVAIEFVLIAGALAGVLTHISPRHILLNALEASSGFGSFIQFFIDNFFVKSIQSRLLALLWVGFLIYLVRDIRTTLRHLSGVDGLLLARSLGGNRR